MVTAKLSRCMPTRRIRSRAERVALSINDERAVPERVTPARAGQAVACVRLAAGPHDERPQSPVP
eukprot:7384759-Prymnesium_polylepis.1